jgi:serine/threonine protein kinase
MNITSKQIGPGYAPIPGYVLEELIGRGGYGEVWRASAPGGMKKAIKFVFGNMGERRTEQELKSLERIKTVQHPFILGLERFEFVDNQLVVVTELAEGSLEDLVRQHRDRGSCGIPRDTLIAYMRDVADALDHLHQLYQLQHLDIKPANLLMVGGRVKVADFGLLKDLRDIECSVVGGLTPIYAPPEVFDGKPSVHSDQYSMAVMYQELLTGSRPFTGRTIAQLATQHVHNAPDLSPLPPSDQPVVARALEKSFERRFDTCCAFVQALSRPRGSTVTGVVEDQLDDSDDTKTVGASFVAGIGEANVEDLPQLDAEKNSPNATLTRHSLVVALGGTGAECLAELFDRIESEDSSVKPILHSVFLDTDETAISRIRRYEESDYLRKNECLSLPLREPAQYREGGMAGLRSMSRRWIYNVPRSGQTEGMRPLGRLALIDHWSRAGRALKSAVQEVKKATGDTIPNIYLVGSIAGGSGSGMYVDVVHVLRGMLDDAGLENTTIISLLATSPLAADAAHPLALHDTLACLQEIRHLSRPGNSYPGDSHVDIPSLPSARSPLDKVYLVAGSDDATSQPTHRTLVNYLWFDATNGRELLASARRPCEDESEQKTASAHLRSVGIVPLAQHTSFAESVLAPATTRTLLARWLGNPALATSNAESLVSKIRDRCKISREQMLESAIGRYGENQKERRKKLVQFLRELPLSELFDTRLVTKALQQQFDEMLVRQHAESDIQSIVDVLIRELTTQLRKGQTSIIAAIETTRILAKDLRKIEIELNNLAKIHPDPKETESPVDIEELIGLTRAHADLIQVSTHVGEVLLNSRAAQVSAARAAALCHSLSTLEGRLSDAAGLLAQSIRIASNNTSEQTNPWDTFSTPIARQVAPHLIDLHAQTAKPWLTNLVRNVDQQPTPSTLVRTINLAAVALIQRHRQQQADLAISQSTDGLSDSNTLSTTVSQSTFSAAPSHQTVAAVIDEHETPAPIDHSENDIANSMQSARPVLLNCGGQQRVILVASDENELNAYRQEIGKWHDGVLTCVVINNAPPMLIHEAQQISIDNIISRLKTLTGGTSQVSDRLLTRCDIEWSNPQPID